MLYFDVFDEFAHGRLWRNEEGEWHRDNGPALEYKNGTRWWFKNGKAHRLDGPAAEYHDGSKAWYIEGVEYTEKDFNEYMDEYMEKLNDTQVEK